MSVRNQLTHYELQELFRSLQDLFRMTCLISLCTRRRKKNQQPSDNPAPLRSTSNKSSEISSLGRPGTPDLTTPTLAVESCSSSTRSLEDKTPEAS